MTGKNQEPKCLERVKKGRENVRHSDANRRLENQQMTSLTGTSESMAVEVIKKKVTVSRLNLFSDEVQT